MNKKIKAITKSAVSGSSSKTVLETNKPIDIVAAQNGSKNSPRTTRLGRADFTRTAAGSLSKFKSS
jgi:hypothetical protein